MMKTDIKQTTLKNYFLATLLAVGLTACGGGGGGSSDGLSKVKDSDGDGFYDAIDPAPHDASNPGDFSTPEKILENPKVKTALEAAKKHGVPVRADLGHNPPTLTGYYKQRVAEGRIVATSTGMDAGHLLAGLESRVSTKGERFESASVQSDYFEALAYTYVKGSILRGEGSNFSTYEPYKLVCTENGSNYATYGIKVRSATQDKESGNLSAANMISVGLASSGTLTSACDERLAGSARAKWVVSKEAPSQKITDVEDFEYMCVDGDKAYIPGEKWKNKEKKSCKCTTDYDVECE